jgi:ankyrin repeat protein
MVSCPNCLQGKYTALMFAAAGGHFDIIRILLDASTNVRFSSGTDLVTMLLTATVLLWIRSQPIYHNRTLPSYQKAR